LNVKILFLLTLFSILNPLSYASFPLQEQFLEKNNLLITNSEKEKKTEKIKEFVEFKDLKQLLISNNKDLKIYRDQISQAEAILKSKYSLWYPKVNINSNQLPEYSTGRSLNRLSTDTSTNQTTLGIDNTIEWDIINPSRKLDIKIAKSKLENAQFFYQENLERILFESTKRFFSIVALEQEIVVAQEAIKVAEFYLDEAKNRFESGLANKIDVLEANIQLKRNKVNLLKKLGDLKTQKNSLAQLLDLSNEFSISYDKKNLITGIWIKDYEESLSKALKNRQDLKILENNISITSKEALSTLSQKKPNFTLYNTYSYSKSFGESGVASPNKENDIENTSNNVGIKFSLNLFDGGLIKENYNSIIFKEEEQKKILQKKRIEIENSIEEALLKLNISIDQIIYNYSQLISAKESFDISLKRLDAGITTQREIINSQRDLIETESNFINSFSEYNVNLANLKKITGEDFIDLCVYKQSPKGIKNEVFVDFLAENTKINCKKK